MRKPSKRLPFHMQKQRHRPTVRYQRAFVFTALIVHFLYMYFLKHLLIVCCCIARFGLYLVRTPRRQVLYRRGSNMLPIISVKPIHIHVLSNSVVARSGAYSAMNESRSEFDSCIWQILSWRCLSLFL